MGWSLLWSKPALIAYGVIVLVIGYMAWHSHVYQLGYAARVAEDVAAQAELEKKAAIASSAALTGVIHANETDAPAVARTTDRILRDCARVPDPRSPAVPHGTRGKTQDFAADLASDLRTCALEIRRFEGLQVWVKGVTE